MNSQLRDRNHKRFKRALRVRKNLYGTAVKPRLSVHKSNKHIAVQLIDDENGVTLASIGTRSKELQAGLFNRKSKDAAKQVGTIIAQLAQAKQIQKAIFDRGRYKFHGIIAELANAAREAGLQF